MQPIDENRFEDLTVFRTFLVESAAFQTFHQRLASFILPKERRIPFEEEETDVPERVPDPEGRHLFRSLDTAWRRLLVTTGLFEPAPQPGMIRVRWRCVSSKSAPRSAWLLHID